MIHQQQSSNGKRLVKFILLLTLFLLPPLPIDASSVNPSIATELTLDQAVNMALSTNSAGKIALFDYEAAKGALTSARSFRWPTVSGSHTDARTMSAPSVVNPDPVATDRYSNSVNASWILWSGNKVES